MQYSATQLAKMFKISRTTVYSKLEHKELNRFVHDTEQGKRLDIEGLEVLKLLLSDSKVNIQTDVKSTTTNTINEQYIDSLKSQIDYLKKEIEDLKNKNEVLTNHLMQRDMLLLESSEQKKKRPFWRFLSS